MTKDAPPDLAALARIEKLIDAAESTILLPDPQHQGKVFVGVRIDREKCGLARLIDVFNDLLDVAKLNVAKLTLSRTAGREEGLMEAAKWPPADLFAESLSLISLTRYGGEATLSADLHAKLTDFLDRAHAKARALASDPAPGDFKPCPGCPDIATCTNSKTCGHYSADDDGTGPAPRDQMAPVIPCRNDCERDDGFTCAEGECAIDSGRIVRSAPAHPTEPGEVERLTRERDALRTLLRESQDGIGGDWRTRRDAALSTPQPKGETE